MLIGVKQNIKNKISRLAKGGKRLSFYVLIGLVAGLAAIFFHYLCMLGMNFFLNFMAGYNPPSPAGEDPIFHLVQMEFRPWILLFLPAAGGLLCGILVYNFAPEAEGAGVDAAVNAYHNQRGVIRGRVAFVKPIASALIITTGGSGGREGPIVQIGGAIGSFFATKLGFTEKECRIMLAAGIAAGVGSIFRVPLAAAIFAAEVLYKSDFESEVIIPAGIASTVAYCVFCMVFGWGTLFEMQIADFSNPRELIPYIVLAFFLAGGGVCYIKFFFSIRFAFKSLKIPNYLKPGIGGLITGIIGFFWPQTLSMGLGFVQQAINNELSIMFLLALATGKILTTSFSIGSGGSGGVFGPAIVIGGALGGIIGQIFHTAMPGVVGHPGSFVVVGMAGLFAAISNNPISTIIFVNEMTNSHALLLPSLLVCSLSYLLSWRWTIFPSQVKSRIDSKAHEGDFFVDALASTTVNELMPFLRKTKMLPEDASLSALKDFICSHDQRYFPVKDRKNQFSGLFSINDIREIMFDKSGDNLILIRDIARKDIVTTNKFESINEVLKKFIKYDIGAIPIVDEKNSFHFLGMLDRRDVIRFYNGRVEEIKNRR